MTEIRRAPGRRIGLLLWLLVGLWAIGLVLAPLGSMIGHAMWRIEPQSIEIRQEIARLADEQAAARRDFDRATTAEARVDIDRRIRLLTDRAQRLASRETEPAGAWSFDNFRALSGATLLAALGSALLVTALSLVVGYPVAYAAATASAGWRAVLLLIGLIAPHALDEGLRLAVWANLLDPDGPIGAHGPMVLAMVQICALLMILPVYGALATLDRHLIDTARDLGASTLRIHARIVLPHARPGLAIGAILTFMLSAGAWSVPQTLMHGPDGDWSGRSTLGDAFASADWNIAAAQDVALLIASLAVVFGAMRLFRLRWRDLTRRGDASNEAPGTRDPPRRW